MVNLLEIQLLTDEKVLIETLCRMGIANVKEKILFPSCYIYHSNNKCFLVHFKQLFLLTRENGYNNVSEEDLIRRNAVAFCLYNWGLINICQEDIVPYNRQIFVLPFNMKQDWLVKHKFNIATLEQNKTGETL
jgi:hypothetical protein